MRCFPVCLWLLLVGSHAAVTAGDRPVAAPPTPARDFRKHPVAYAGPGRSDPEPADVAEVRLGYFGPSHPAHPDGGDLWQAAALAVDEANRQGGWKGQPFRLLPVWSENPWAGGVTQLAQIIFRDKVWAVVGGIDGPSTHLAEQIVVKALLPLVSPVSTDKTVNLVNVPWMFSCAPGDHLLAPLLAAEIAARDASDPLVLVCSDGHDARLFADELRKRLSERRVVPQYQFDFRPGADVAPVAARVGETKPDRVILVADAQASAALAAELRKRGFTGMLYGGPWLARRRFVQEAGAAAEGAVFPMLCDPQRLPAAFVKAFQDRAGHPPDSAAAQTYDAVQLLVAAIRQAGLNRAKIRDALQALSPCAGAAGTITWDPSASNTRPPLLGTIRHSHVARIDQPAGR